MQTPAISASLPLLILVRCGTYGMRQVLQSTSPTGKQAKAPGRGLIEDLLSPSLAKHGRQST
jgi:hypothetical protein